MPKNNEKKDIPNITIEGARILFRNFKGEERQYNPAGRRNFCVILDPDLADKIKKDGWNVRELKPREAEDEPQPYLQVRVSYMNRPPKINIITSAGKTALDEDTVGMLDWAEIKNVDLVIRPYQYDVNGRQGISAYLKSMYVTLEEDYLEQKYTDVEHHVCNHNCEHCREHCDD